MKSVFKHANSHELQREAYPLILEACEYISKSGADCFAPDVYAAVTSGQVELVIGYRDDISRGLFTCYVTKEYEKRQLYVWHGYIRPGSPSEYLIDAFTYLEQLAKERGCSEIVFSTTRKGWLRAIRKFGFELKQYTFSRKL